MSRMGKAYSYSKHNAACVNRFQPSFALLEVFRFWFLLLRLASSSSKLSKLILNWTLSSEELKDNHSCADNIGLTDSYVINRENRQSAACATVFRAKK